jgi:hypothetical protein
MPAINRKRPSYRSFTRAIASRCAAASAMDMPPAIFYACE